MKSLRLSMTFFRELRSGKENKECERRKEEGERTCNLNLKTWDLELGTWALEPGTDYKASLFVFSYILRLKQ